MDKKIKYLILGMLLLTLSIIPSIDARLGNFPKNTCVDIKTVSNSSAVNISTISYVNRSTAVSNQAMTKVGKTFNYTFCDTAIVGIYVYDYFDLEGNVFVNDFSITPIGDDITTGSSIIYIIILITLSIFFVAFLIIAIKTPYDNLGEMSRNGPVITRITKTKYVKLIAIWISYAMFMWFLATVTGLTNNYIRFAPLVEITNNLYGFLNVILYGLSIAILMLLVWNTWKDIILNKIILRDGKAFLNNLN